MLLAPILLIASMFVPSPQARDTAPPLPAGVELMTQLRTRLDAARAKVGDRVELKLLRSVIVQGKVLIPVDARLLGHVTEVSPRGADNNESRIALVIESAQWKHRSLPLNAVVVRQGVMVYKRVERPPGERLGDTAEADRLTSASEITLQAPTPQTTGPVALPPTTTATPQTQTSLPQGAGTTSSTAQTGTPAASEATTVQEPTRSPSNMDIENRTEAQHHIEVTRIEGPKAKGVTVQRAADPRLGNALVSRTGNVVVPKGVLLVLVSRNASE